MQIVLDSQLGPLNKYELMQVYRQESFQDALLNACCTCSSIFSSLFVGAFLRHIGAMMTLKGLLRTVYVTMKAAHQPS